MASSGAQLYLTITYIVWILALGTFAQHQYDCTEPSLSRFLAQLSMNGSDAREVATRSHGTLCSHSDVSLSSRASLACFISRFAFGGTPTTAIPEYLAPGSALYTNRTEANWSDNCWQNASCIVSPATTADVATTLRIITFAGSNFATRGGGHNNNVGFSSVGPDGVLIDMVNINTTALSADHLTASIGGGQTLGGAYAALDKLGYYFAGGKDTHPAVGGYYLGAGLTYFPGEYGVGSSGVKNIEIVLANSSVIQANESNHLDLLYAIRGGGPNYGIITRYDVEAHPKPQVWFVIRAYNAVQVPELLRLMVKYQQAAEDDAEASIIFTSTAEETVMGYIHKGGAAWPAIFQPFQDVPYNSSLVNSTIGSPYQLTQATSELGGLAAAKYGGMSIALKPSLEVYNESYATFLEVAKSAAQNFSGTMAYGIQPFSSTAARLSQRNGGSPLNLEVTSQTWFVCTISWEDEAASTRALAAMQEVANAVHDAAAKRNLALPFLFMNDAYQEQNVFEGYGAASQARLKSIASAYDPTEVFQRNQNNGFLLSKH